MPLTSWSSRCTLLLPSRDIHVTFVFFALIFIRYSFITAFGLIITSCSPFYELATTALSSPYLITLTIFPLLQIPIAHSWQTSVATVNNEQQWTEWATLSYSSSNTTCFRQCLTNHHKSLLVNVQFLNQIALCPIYSNVCQIATNLTQLILSNAFLKST